MRFSADRAGMVLLAASGLACRSGVPTPVASRLPPPAAQPPSPLASAQVRDTAIEFDWVRRFGEAGHESLTALDASADGSVVFAMRGGGAIRVDGRVLGGAAVLVKLSPDGQVVWAHSLDGWSWVHDLAIDAHGDVVVAGSFTRNVDFGGEVHTTPAKTSRPYVAKYAGLDASLAWVFIGDTDRGGANAVALAASGDVLVVGWYQHAMTLCTRAFAAMDSRDGFLLRLSGDTGTCVWGRGARQVRAATLDSAVVVGDLLIAAGETGSTKQIRVQTSSPLVLAASVATGHEAWSTVWLSRRYASGTALAGAGTRALLVGQVDGDLQVFEREFRCDECAFVAGLGLDGRNVTWFERFEDGTFAADMAALPDGHVWVAGSRICGLNSRRCGFLRDYSGQPGEWTEMQLRAGAWVHVSHVTGGGGDRVFAGGEFRGDMGEAFGGGGTGAFVGRVRLRRPVPREVP